MSATPPVVPADPTVTVSAAAAPSGPPTAADAANWVERNWEAWAATGLRILLILVVAFLMRAVLRRAISRAIGRMTRADRPGATTGTAGLLASSERRRQRSAAIASILRSVTSLMVLGTAGLMVLSQLGIQLGPLVASAGVIGVAIGFGARNLVTDVLSGMFMLLEDQYGVGDRIDTGEAVGDVLEIGLRVTTLRGDDGEVWYIRNGEIRRVANLSQGWATAAVETEVRADADPDLVRDLIAAAGRAMSREEPWDELLWGPVQVLGLESVTLDSMVLRTAVKTQPGKAGEVGRELRRRIKAALDTGGVEQVDAAGLALRRLREQEQTDSPPRMRLPPEGGGDGQP